MHWYERNSVNITKIQILHGRRFQLPSTVLTYPRPCFEVLNRSHSAIMARIGESS